MSEYSCSSFSTFFVYPMEKFQVLFSTILWNKVHAEFFFFFYFFFFFLKLRIWVWCSRYIEDLCYYSFCYMILWKLKCPICMQRFVCFFSPYSFWFVIRWSLKCLFVNLDIESLIDLLSSLYWKSIFAYCVCELDMEKFLTRPISTKASEPTSYNPGKSDLIQNPTPQHKEPTTVVVTDILMYWRTRFSRILQETILLFLSQLLPLNQHLVLKVAT